MKKTKDLIYSIFPIFFIVFPVFTFAASACPIGPTTICTLIDDFQGIATLVIILLMILATVIFIWGIIRYILAGGSEQRKKEGLTLIIWGIIGLFILVAMWGFVKIIEDTFGVEESRIPKLPGGTF